MLIDCVSGGAKNRENLDLSKDIDKDMLKELTERASSPGWDGNLYKYRF